MVSICYPTYGGWYVDKDDGMAKQIKEAKISEQPAIMDKMVEINQKLAALEKELSQVPEQTKFYGSEYSGETLDPEYERNR